MSSALALIALALTAAAPPPSDLSFADPKPAPLTAEQQAAAFEAHTTEVVRSAPSLTVAAGDTVFVEVTVPVSASSHRPRAAPVAVRSDRGASTAPWAEVRSVKSGSAVVRYAVRARSDERGEHGLRFVLDVRDGATRASVGRARIEHRVTVGPPAPTAETIERDRDAHLFHQAQAQRAYEKLPELKDYLRLDRVDRAPSASRIPADKDPFLQAFLHHRLHADIARERLRAAAQVADPPLARAAALALGALSVRPTGPAARARAIEGVTTEVALDMARRALDALDVDVAEGFLNKLQISGRLEPEELIRALALLGGVNFLRGKAAAADKAYGSAFCLSPRLEPAVTRPLLQDRFQEAKKTNRCTVPLQVAEVRAERRATDDGPVVHLDIRVTPDPYGVISGAEVQQWGFGGSVERSQQVRITEIDGFGHLLADFPDDEQSATDDRVLVKVFVRDVSGVTLATYGDPDPIAVPIAHAEIGKRFEVPWWVWAVAGGLVVAGSVTAAGVWASSRDTEPTRGIGPIDVRF